VKDYFFITKFQLGGLSHDHGLLWVQNVPIFGVSENEKNACFVNKYLTTFQTMFSKEICNMQIHQDKKKLAKKIQLNCQF
jgi:hypothetical protein